VHDDETVILRYPRIQAVLMSFWDWSFARKDMEVYGDGGSLVTVDPDHVQVRYHGEANATDRTASPPPAQLWPPHDPSLMPARPCGAGGR
jgi:predicted dehydrogenase